MGTWLTTAQAAVEFGLEQWKISGWARQGKIKARHRLNPRTGKAGAYWEVTRESLQARLKHKGTHLHIAGSTPIDVTERIARMTETGSPESCWPWLGSLNSGGVPQINLKGKPRSVRRLLMERRLGRELPNELDVWVRCSEKLCVNPQHLICGSLVQRAQTANTARGTRLPQAKLTEEVVPIIRQLYALGLYSDEELGDTYGVSAGTISNAVRGVSWKHVGGPLSSGVWRRRTGGPGTRKKVLRKF